MISFQDLGVVEPWLSACCYLGNLIKGKHGKGFDGDLQIAAARFGVDPKDLHERWKGANRLRSSIENIKARIERMRVPRSKLTPEFKLWFYQYVNTIEDDNLFGAVLQVSKIVLDPISSTHKDKTQLEAFWTKSSVISRCKNRYFPGVPQKDVEKHIAHIEDLYRKHEGPFVWETEEKMQLKDVFGVEKESVNKMKILQGELVAKLQRDHPFLATVMRRARLDEVRFIQVTVPRDMLPFEDAIGKTFEQFVKMDGMRFTLEYEK